MNTTALLLAAGSSRRFGGDKRLARLPCGSSVLQRTVTTIRQSGLSCFVVLADGDEAIGAQLTAQQINWDMCPDAHLGMGHSLAFGVQACRQASGWLIALADMPYIRTSTYLQVAQQLQQHDIVVPMYQHQRGHPVGFSQRHAKALLQCHGDQGARHLMQQYTVHYLPTDDAGILTDIDRPTDIMSAPIKR